ncbi:hypothetical protein NON00_16350 [Roseomonas sp. GC11]|uniref:hypothetical protein n=1 Tax=Roseomonas sp. GC11 TaxID=2950546 RepID=UPI00210C268A|nr:hypothetical protein [Roseomonas sp. GC11]MCQ4161491.1 hypothetical protein [Roseomonas sp. GC11]
MPSTASSSCPAALPASANDNGARPAAPLAQLLAEAALRAEDRVLIIGPRGAGLLCAAIRQGCRSGAEAISPPAHPEPADLVLAPAVASEAAALSVARCAGRALAAGGQGGRLVLALLGQGARALARSARACLRAEGFRQIRLREAVEREGPLLLLGSWPRPLPVPVPLPVRGHGRPTGHRVPVRGGR